MPTIALNHYNLQASREVIEQLKDFYCSVVGLSPGYRPPLKSFGYWLYAGGFPVLHLSEESLNDQRSVHARSTFHHAAFTCTAPEEMEAVLIQKRVAYRRSQLPHGGTLQIFFQDPAGNGVELNFSGAPAAT